MKTTSNYSIHCTNCATLILESTYDLGAPLALCEGCDGKPMEDLKVPTIIRLMLMLDDLQTKANSKRFLTKAFPGSDLAHSLPFASLKEAKRLLAEAAFEYMMDGTEDPLAEHLEEALKGRKAFDPNHLTPIPVLSPFTDTQTP